MEPVALAALSFLCALASALALTPRLAAAFREEGHTVKDMYKRGTPEVPTLGGVCLLVGCFLSIILTVLLAEEAPTAAGVHAVYLERILTYYLVMFFFATFGLLDDLFAMGRRIKLVVPLVLVLPFVRFVDPVVRLPLLGHVPLPPAALYAFLAVYVMVVANLVNFHASYNGLCTGLSAIIMATMALKSALNGRPEGLLLAAPLLGSLLGFLRYNLPPASIFPGNSGTFLLGGSLGFFLILEELKAFGVVALSAHVLNLLVFVAFVGTGFPAWLRGELKFPKFGSVRDDGTLEVPNPGTLKYLVAYYRPVTERQAVLALYALTALSCAAALALT